MKIHGRQELIRFRTRDSFLISSLLITAESDPKEEILDIPILLQIHGLLGHFLARGTPRLLPHALVKRGFNAMSMNTRLAYAGQITGQGIFDDTIKDIDAAVEFLTNEGFKNIFILGYSLGACMAAYWASNREHPNVKGLILEGVLYSSPDSKRKRFAEWGSFPTYEQASENAKAVLGDDPYNSAHDEILIFYHSRGPNLEPLSDEIFTYKTWWFMAGPEAHAAMTYKHIDKINLPILMIRGENDHIVEEWEPEVLAQIARKSGNQKVRVRQIPDAGHDCMENSDEMLKEIIHMLTKWSKE
ncbi:MAG: alpha/beta fold hydrolase [Deltaproteobacteria bacterium]|nr:alpha/beta fold hydrolase [Deltaproteobacteria bacterium]MBW2237921.1 alpha/beta fold hydrolase [Deltaproteobacteria bacterium]MBW2572655.1 alpha/beta fold hydrolase [Deltaproteobacteria bacterium]MBW2711574.1 alpha/beta fold hydrolase [Deltaproteobacteria bacterium]